MTDLESDKLWKETAATLYLIPGDRLEIMRRVMGNVGRRMVLELGCTPDYVADELQKLSDYYVELVRAASPQGRA